MSRRWIDRWEALVACRNPAVVNAWLFSVGDVTDHPDGATDVRRHGAPNFSILHGGVVPPSDAALNEPKTYL